MINMLLNQSVISWHGFGDIMGMETQNRNLRLRIQELEKEAILSALQESNWIMARAAKKLGITERMIGYKVKKYGIRAREVRWTMSATMK
jgi:transcriptional regulator with GAF, ATPase, and Fis domain